MVVNWLADRDMLPKFVPEARIYTYDWDANCLRDPPVQTLSGHAEKLLGIVSEHQRRHYGRRPVIFVASCFGGLILSEVQNAIHVRYQHFADMFQAINQAAAEGSPYRNVLFSTAGCVFLATPFQGSAASAQARWRIVVGGIMGDRASDVLVQALDRGHEVLVRRARSFARIANAKTVRLPVFCFFETKKTELLRRYVSPAYLPWLSTRITHKLVRLEVFWDTRGLPRALHATFASSAGADFSLELGGRRVISLSHWVRPAGP